jgi:hypothetical protein
VIGGPPETRTALHETHVELCHRLSLADREWRLHPVAGHHPAHTSMGTGRRKRGSAVIIVAGGPAA